MQVQFQNLSISPEGSAVTCSPKQYEINYLNQIALASMVAAPSLARALLSSFVARRLVSVRAV